MDSSKEYPKRLRRSESFLGVHFDFHARADDMDIGKNTTREMIENIILKVRPDYLQCDSKGGPGFSSYPTRVGHPAPGIVADGLRVWRDVTAEHGVALYVHHAGLSDAEALRRHPEWGCIDADGLRSTHNGSTYSSVSMFSSYVDELLLPQLKELSDEYAVDGVWMDGECHAVWHDYSDRAIEAFRLETGMQDIPREPGDPAFYAFSQFFREAFRRYVRHWVDEIHRHNPEFQVTSNWAYSSSMPEPVTADVDYISGDYDLRNSVNMARFSGRCMAREGKPWDLMAWSFSRTLHPEGIDESLAETYSTKSPRQLMREAATVLALGGGFEVYFMQKRDGSVAGWHMDIMAEVAAFCRARQEICHRAEAVPQIALLYSTAAFYRQATRPFGTWNYDEVTGRVEGTLISLLESQNAVEILMEHTLAGRMGEYPLIVIPEWGYLEAEFREELLGYVREGGSLLVIGPQATGMFEEALGITFAGELDEEGARWLAYGGVMAGLRRRGCRPVTLKEGVAAFGRLYPVNDDVGPYEIAASIAAYGKGKIAGVYFSYGESYLEGTSHVGREFLEGLVRELFPEPMVEVKGSHYVDVTVNRKDGKLAVNLVNTAGPHADTLIWAFDEIPPVGPLEVTIRHGEKPGRVTLEPAGKEVPYVYDVGKIALTLPRLEIHDVIVVE